MCVCVCVCVCVCLYPDLHFILRCVCVSSLTSHVVEIEAQGPGSSGNCFSVKTVRVNPAASGVVTGHQTYSSFLSSLLGECIPANPF